MLYAILKLIYRVGLWVFFKKLEIRNKELIPNEGPLLVVSNHPNTFMDPVVIAAQLQQPVYFIAKSTIFGSSLQNWLLQRMHLIPIHRREDAPGQPVNNDEAFAASFKALATKKTLIIFPEGNSFNERRLRKIKTGTARIALGAETQSNYSLGTKILPIGLNYSAPTRFRSNVFVNVGQPISVADYAQAYQSEDAAAILTLTEDIKQQLERLIINTPTEEEDELAKQIETIYKDKLIDEPSPTQEQEFVVSQSIVESIVFFSSKAPERVAALKEDIKNYLLQLDTLRLQDSLLGKGKSSILRHSLAAVLFLIIGFPAYVFGLVHNYIPYIIPAKVARSVTKEKEWYAPIMLTVGIFAFPIYYTFMAFVFWYWFPLIPSLLIYLVSLPVSGFFTLRYWSTLNNTHGQWLFLRLFFKRGSMVQQLQRQAIINELEQAKQEFLQERDAAKSQSSIAPTKTDLF
ncbi:lysophospholipid acyltransferase family protein [Pontibacter harenae]|uniref:lysophospholipid acyltransferase family protein n=1 Tax=Pontibacter harenae TaxID=2894083 RepID=UPI001E4438E0|nr:lysophospholipid acyltransferase family protein [Pontibacter harenae]MCC9168026.1 lysophospholipid acyltransferase family protein [Pontibacter harenae]